MIEEPQGIEHFKPDTRVQCIYQFTGGSARVCSWKGTFKDLLCEVGENDGVQIRIRMCPNCDCPFVISDPKLRTLGLLQ